MTGQQVCVCVSIPVPKGLMQLEVVTAGGQESLS